MLEHIINGNILSLLLNVIVNKHSNQVQQQTKKHTTTKVCKS